MFTRERGRKAVRERCLTALTSKDGFGEQLPIFAWRQSDNVVALAFLASWKNLLFPFFLLLGLGTEGGSIRQVPACHLLALSLFLLLLLPYSKQQELPIRHPIHAFSYELRQE
ncbi:hypothetical protein M441DRAFT_62871 [Trichoderma asperellum CBS 433.97]|uniref:Uncharacterized protein n=1 Tax=Trichoderma asperellum (strain ATCC 204424 / CBS 433.97 / NBRC 101777) TaxID=1042311 RepID=A0A2T3YS56_TRIA4|nr:hypothetical protein M441DRAFT_62871 [Trichoderma asperellum CBS 433.97]PTB35411.1 hypothetical protein M441DRAFT_62871 [Trichoderma asperellum CBS 433.97]